MAGPAGRNLGRGGIDLDLISSQNQDGRSGAGHHGGQPGGAQSFHHASDGNRERGNNRSRACIFLKSRRARRPDSRNLQIDPS